MGDPIQHQAGQTFGPTFAAELGALVDVVGSWGDDGVIEFTPVATAEQRAAVAAIAAAHDPGARPPAPPQGAAFVGAMFRSLAGADDAAKLERGARLLGKSGRALGLVNLLDVSAPSGARLAVARGVWAAIKRDPMIGIGGSDLDALTAEECSAIEADGRDHFGIDLAG